MFSFLDGILGNFITLILGHSIPGLGLVVTILLIFLSGYSATHIFGEKLFHLGEEIIYKIPVVKHIYASAKQINDVLFVHKGTDEFRRACLIEYPPQRDLVDRLYHFRRRGLRSKPKPRKRMLNVFIANTPTPATGFLVLVPAKEVVLLDMKIEAAFKYIISGGVLKPTDLPTELPAKKES